MAKFRVRTTHPLFKRLRQFDREIGVWAVGLRLNKKLDELRYSESTPRNCKTFGDTGGDGVHFSFLVQNGKIGEHSPVVMTVPCAAANIVVGENLLDFLCLSSRRGCFGLEQLAYAQRKVAVEAFTNPNWKPTEKWHRSVGFAPGKEERHVLALVAKEFGLQPWRSRARFAVLRKRYAALLELPPDVAIH